MAGIGGWRRSRYPLQATNMDITGPAVSSKKKRTKDPSIDSAASMTGDSGFQAVWQQARTGSQAKRYSITSQARSDSDNSSYQHPDDGLGPDDSSTAVSLSHRSVSPLPDTRGHLPHSDGVSSIRISRNENKEVTRVPSKHARNFSYPLQTMTEAPMDDDSCASSAEVERELASSPDSPAGKNMVGKKTLRRTPRSRRLREVAPAHTPDASLSRTSPTPVVDDKASSISSKPGESHPSEEISRNKSWRRQVYPLQAAGNSSITRPKNPKPLGRDSFAAGELNPRQNQDNQRNVPLSTSRLQRSYPVQNQPVDSVSLPDSPPSSENESLENKRSSLDPGQAHAGADGVHTPRQQKYQHHEPGSQANYRHSPTPPSSPERESLRSDMISLPGSYPVQAPASDTIAKLSTKLPIISPVRVIQSESMVSPNQGNSSQQRGRRSKSLKGHRYPLQAPASVTDLRQEPTLPPTGQENDNFGQRIPAGRKPANPAAPPRSKSLRRQVYPLQSPASATNLKPIPSSPSMATTVKQDNRNTTRSNDIEQTTEQNRPRGPQVHSLPTSASVANVPSQKAPESVKQNEIQSKNVLAANETQQDRLKVPQLNIQVEAPSSTANSKEKDLATKVLDRWRRLTYPLQSPKHVSPFHRSPSPMPPQERKKETDEPVHLPKNIPAVKDVKSPQTKGRTIVVCLDGTGDKFDNDNSNIVHLVAALKKDDPNQVSYYQAGIGTYSAGGLSSGFEAALDMAVGSGLGLHVRDAYHFLMHSYKEGDRICIFGFSRGAYSARCLAGMIHKVGLLPPRNIQQIPFAYEFYKNDTPEGWKQSSDFKKTFSIDICVYFLGCFDSVASVGFIPRQLPLSTTPTNKARYFRHAMALDERRAKFKICRHQVKKWEDIKEPTSPIAAVAKRIHDHVLPSLPTVKDQNDQPEESLPHKHFGKHYHPNVTDEEYERLTGHEAPFETDALEVWFAGAHADIGGGAVPNDERHKLAQIPLRWMIRQAFECNTGIIFKTKVLAEYGLDVHTLWPRYSALPVPSHGPPPSLLEKYEESLPPRSIRRSKLVPIDRHENGEHFYHLQSPTDEDWTPEQVEDFYDAMTPINDQLIQAPTWWILEGIPVEYKVPVKPGVVSLVTGPNLGRYRGVDDEIPNLHWTVLHRVRHMGYKIQARTAAQTTWKTVV